MAGLKGPRRKFEVMCACGIAFFTGSYTALYCDNCRVVASLGTRYTGRYQITKKQYDEMLEQQDHVCAICGEGPSAGCTRLDVDHDHDTGHIRGLLCRKCNTALGRLKTIELLSSAITYLERVKKVD